jgi:beta-xylosidase
VAEEDWLQMLSQLLEVSIKRWGKRWVSTWRFEFHMPERLFQSSDPEQFLDLFAHSMEVIRRELPDAQIGGPALPWDNGHLERWQHWFEGVERRRLQVDFVSMELWGDYTMRVDGFSGQFGEWRETRTIESISAADASLAVQKVQSVHGRMARHGLAAAKLYVSALGITKTQAMAAQISGHCSAYLLKCAMELQELTDGLGCWKLLNHEAEYADEFRILSSGCGLLSRFGLKNPNWYAYCFLGKMLPQVVYRGWNSLVTTDGYGRYAIVLHNCKAYTPYFFKHYLDDTALDFQNTRFYTDHAAVAQTLSLEGMEAATYQVRQYLVGDHHGCIASAMRQLGISESLTASDIRYVAAQSQPYQHIYRVRADGTLKLSVTLQPNESMLLLVSTEESMES